MKQEFQLPPPVTDDTCALTAGKQSKRAVSKQRG